MSAPGAHSSKYDIGIVRVVCAQHKILLSNWKKDTIALATFITLGKLFYPNHRGAGIFYVFMLLGKNKLDLKGQKNFNANTTMAVLFEIRFRSLFFDFEKRRQSTKVTAIP